MTHIAALRGIWLAVVAQGGDFDDMSLAMQVVVIGVCVLILFAMIGITVFIVYLLYSLLDALPPKYQLMEPPLVWLMLIPCFNLIWNFFVFTRISESYQKFFHDHNRLDVGDCGFGIGVAYCVCAVLASIPCVNYVTGIFCGPAMIVLIILYLVKLHELKRDIADWADANRSE